MNASSTSTNLFTCEHGGNRIPRKYAARFVQQEELLQSHRGWDLGALRTGTYFHQQVASQLFASRTSRLLIDLNRSESHPSLFSKLVSPPGDSERKELLETYYRPWRQEVSDWIAGQVRQKKFVWHLSFHSFTPVLDGEVRTAEIGLLYDPRRTPERTVCDFWRTGIRETLPGLRVRMNYPYRGVADGHTTALRKRFSEDQYAGIELEVNQQLYQQSGRQIMRMIAGLCQSWNRAISQAADAC
ncbi:N-formylglutamate amidohydrolase [Bremerella sp. JC770]|uniref:N-formylglutamate amidohydrolase n=1 Tax=Bremerella sp. JC770 TaxID=3232137 RepID=UPI00345B3E82